jgi:hypothetical protein
MKYCIYDSKGNILRTGECPEEFLSLQPLAAGEGVFVGEASHNDLIDLTDPEAPALIVNGKGPQPSKFHTWNKNTLVWEPDLARAKESRKIDIEAERERRIYAPILYDGLVLDADVKAQRNIEVKVSEMEKRLTRGRPAPANRLMWRDATDQMKLFNSAAEYVVWLHGLVIELGERGTDAYAWSWTKKAEVDAAVTVEQVNSVSLT